MYRSALSALLVGLLVLLFAGAASAGGQVGIGDLPGCSDPSDSGGEVFNDAEFLSGVDCEKACKLVAKACAGVGKGHLSCGNSIIKASAKLFKLECNTLEDPEDKALCKEEAKNETDSFKQVVKNEKEQVKSFCAEAVFGCVETCENPPQQF